MRMATPLFGIGTAQQAATQIDRRKRLIGKPSRLKASKLIRIGSIRWPEQLRRIRNLAPEQ